MYFVVLCTIAYFNPSIAPPYIVARLQTRKALALLWRHLLRRARGEADVRPGAAGIGPQ